MVGCENQTTQFVCGTCCGWGADARVPAEWWVWYKLKPSPAKMRTLLETCFEPHEYRIG